jgi:hypothetical protein
VSGSEKVISIKSNTVAGSRVAPIPNDRKIDGLLKEEKIMTYIEVDTSTKTSPEESGQ